MMQREKILTGDGSYTWYLPSLNEYYHSRFGAINESLYIFIGAGFGKVSAESNKINILEMGSGTGLNIWLTCCKAIKTGISVHYTALEPFPPEIDEILSLDYSREADPEEKQLFLKILQAPWKEETLIHEQFRLHKIPERLEEAPLKDGIFDLVYFDAFGPEVQPELWTPDAFRKISRSMKPGGTLVTYSAKGSVKRALKASGFNLERLPGPPGKRHMIRAVRQTRDESLSSEQ